MNRQTGFFARQALKYAAVLVLAALSGLRVQMAHAEGNLRDVTFLLAAPPGEIAFAPFMLADKRGYYAQAGLRIRWVALRGGVDVGKQLAAGNGDLGDALGDTSIILRNNGIPIRGVALMGGRPLHQFVTRDDRNIHSLEALRGHTLSVMSYEDTSYFVTLALLGSVGLSRQDVRVQAGGPAGVWQDVAQGRSDGLVGTPEQAGNVEAAGVKVTLRPTDEFVPSMGQAIVATDRMIQADPQMIRGFVQATMRAMTDIQNDPERGTIDYVAAVPSYANRLPYVRKVLQYYAKNVFPSQLPPGAFDPKIVAKVQQAYLASKVIRQSAPVDSLYTNDFVQ